MTDHLTKCGDIPGKHVLGQDGAKLEAAREIFVDLATGAIRFVVVEAASLLGGTGKFHPVPWRAISYNAGIDAFQINIAKDYFKASPSYDRDQLANASYGWGEQSARYFERLSPDPDASDVVQHIGTIGVATRS